MKQISLILLLVLTIAVPTQAQQTAGPCDLERVIAANDLDRVQKFLAAGFDINSTCNKKTPLIIACERAIGPSKEDRVAVIEYILSQKPDLNARDAFGETALLKLLRTPKATDTTIHVITILLKAGANVNIASNGGDTPLKIGLTHKDKRISDLFYFNLSRKEEPAEKPIVSKEREEDR
jgi:ankyrin repeat protein